MFHKNSSPLSEVEMKRRRCLCVFACFSFFFSLNSHFIDYCSSYYDLLSLCTSA